MGLVQVENININAEAYDVAMDISFPRGIVQRKISTSSIFYFALRGVQGLKVVWSFHVCLLEATIN